MKILPGLIPGAIETDDDVFRMSWGGLNAGLPDQHEGKKPQQGSAFQCVPPSGAVEDTDEIDTSRRKQHGHTGKSDGAATFLRADGRYRLPPETEPDYPRSSPTASSGSWGYVLGDVRHNVLDASGHEMLDRVLG